MKGVLTMSLKEFDRLQIINQLEEKRIKVKEASELLELSERQLYRLLLGLWTDFIHRSTNQISQYLHQR